VSAIFRRHQILFREGDRGDEMFIVRRGTILISKSVTGKVEQVLVRVEPFDFFGEMSLFDGSPRPPPPRPRRRSSCSFSDGTACRR